MSEHVRVRRDWIDVRHEYLQNDGRWMAGACSKPGFCRECNRDGERQPMEFISIAWEKDVEEQDAARIVIAAHLYIPVKLADDDAVLRLTAFRRMAIAYHLELLRGMPIGDDAVYAARTIGDLIALVTEKEAA